MAARLEELQATHSALRPGKQVLVAVSGGRDSMALLHFLAASGWKKLVVAHLNHQLRGKNSERDAEFVRKFAQAQGLRCVIGKMDIRKLAAKQRLSLETAGRDARRDFFLKTARKHRCCAVFMAHHAEDQAETVLQHLFRGSALRGVSGMPPATMIGKSSLLLLRPALDVSRRNIDEYLATYALKHREDESNASLKFTRNRVRHELLPMLDDIFRRDVSPVIARFAELARQDDDFLLRHVHLSAGKNIIGADGSLTLTSNFRRQHPALQRRVLWLWLAGRTPHIGSREIQAAVAMLSSGGVKKINLPGDAHLCRDGRRLWLEPPSKTTGRKSTSQRLSRRR